MNTNSNTYTIIYTSLVVVVVAAVLAFVSQKLGPMQAANEKAETVSQILTAAQFGEKESWQEKGNAATLRFYSENILRAVVVDENGAVVDSLDKASARVYAVSELKAQNYNIKGAAPLRLPVYVFKNGISVLPVYGAGLWGPVWGYIAFEKDCRTVAGAYFDHESETPGLGGKIKDDPSFRESFKAKILASGGRPLAIAKAGSAKDIASENKVDAITGATMTSKGLDAAINAWLNAFDKYLKAAAVPSAAEPEKTVEE